MTEISVWSSNVHLVSRGSGIERRGKSRLGHKMIFLLSFLLFPSARSKGWLIQLHRTRKREAIFRNVIHFRCLELLMVAKKLLRQGSSKSSNFIRLPRKVISSDWSPSDGIDVSMRQSHFSLSRRKGKKKRSLVNIVTAARVALLRFLVKWDSK